MKWKMKKMQSKRERGGGGEKWYGQLGCDESNSMCHIYCTHSVHMYMYICTYSCY